MSETAPAAADQPDAPPAEPPAPRRRKPLLLLAALLPVLLAATGGGLWFAGLIPGVTGPGQAAAKPTATAQPATGTPAFLEMPEIIANLNVPGRRISYVKLHARLELARPGDEKAVKAGMPRLLDLFQTYLREMRPEELHGSAGTWRLREELMARANLALAPARVVDVLFTELLVQ